MNFCSVPYEADYGMYADSKMKSVPQYPLSMSPGQGQGQSMSMQPLNPPQMNLQMQMPMPAAPPMSSYPMQSMPLAMMPSGNAMTPMSTMTSQLPIGAVTPLNSMTMMPMMGNPMGAIDAPGINAVIPDLQSMTTSMGQMQPLQQYNQSGSATPMHQGRLTGGASGGMVGSCPSSPSHPGSWNSGPNSSQMMNNGNVWQYSQPMQNHQPQYHQQQQQHQQYQQQQPQHHHQHHQQGSRTKASYEVPPSSMYRDVRNGLNNPF
ncbi:G-box-binding factor isoform X2 [Drosophila elegans]|uniref:G-box-binding factor isoform X2 n=1 Tax=Drosophila elegans TaxID=30023 RepID=UPI001BC84A1D|nr:G-box-binding factor isoform X2 [Drosophila elegans]